MNRDYIFIGTVPTHVLGPSITGLGILQLLVKLILKDFQMSITNVQYSRNHSRHHLTWNLTLNLKLSWTWIILSQRMWQEAYTRVRFKTSHLDAHSTFLLSSCGERKFTRQVFFDINITFCIHSSYWSPATSVQRMSAVIHQMNRWRRNWSLLDL